VTTTTLYHFVLATFIDVKHEQILGLHKVNRRSKRDDVRRRANFGPRAEGGNVISRARNTTWTYILDIADLLLPLVTLASRLFFQTLSFHRQRVKQNGSYASRLPDQTRQVSLGVYNRVLYSVADLRCDGLFSIGQNRSDRMVCQR
jgi:hypothetical protein